VKRFAGPLRVASPLQRLSPTGLGAFAECSLRGVWQATRQVPLLPSSPAARLGSIAHRLLEEAGRGSFAAVAGISEIEERWEALVSEADLAMSGSSLERRFVPLAEHLPKYDVVRLRAIARASELSRDVPGFNLMAGDARTSHCGYELRVKSRDGLIEGRIDRAFLGADGVVLQDYKSGAILVADSASEPELKSEYIRQLRLYAALYHEDTGTWPSQLQLVPLGGAPADVAFTPEQCLLLLDEARRVLTDVNGNLARFAEDWESAESALASPSPSACRFCAYRPACLGYLSRSMPDADREWPADVWGRFENLTRLGNGRLMLTIMLDDDSRFFIRDVGVSLSSGDALQSGGHGTLVGVFGGRWTQSQVTFEEGPLTAVHAV
jgi:hypothetical protein